MRKIKQNKTEGDIFLHSMPGRYEKIDDIIDELRTENITAIISLTGRDEIIAESPGFAKLIEDKNLSGFTHIFNPVPDYGIPSSEMQSAVYRKTILKSAELLENSNILVHCGAGIGRTGSFAVILLRKLGFDFETASTLVKEAGSKPETDEQISFAGDFVVD